MSDPYEKVKAGRLTFKGGSLATRAKSIDKKKKKKKTNSKESSATEFLSGEEALNATAVLGDGEEGSNTDNKAEDIYTIDAAKRMKYDELFPVEAKKFGYDPKAKSTSVEQALDDRVKKKADRYCK